MYIYYTQKMLSFRNIETNFAVVVHQPSLDDFASLRRELEVPNEASITRYVLETHRLGDILSTASREQRNIEHTCSSIHILPRSP